MNRERGSAGRSKLRWGRNATLWSCWGATMGLLYYLGDIHYHLSHTNLFLGALLATCAALCLAFHFWGREAGGSP